MDELKPKGLDLSNVELTKHKTPTELKMVEDTKTVENLCTVVGFVVSATNDIYKVTDSAGGSKITTAEFLEFLPEGFKLPKVINALKEIPKEVLDKITDAEIQQITDVLSASLYLIDKASLFRYVKRAITIINEIKDLIQDIASGE
jgi:hypothetical protein